MLTVLAFAMVATFMTLIMSGRVSAMVALIVVPVAFGLLAGFRGELGPMMLDGVKALAPTGVMLAFAILYFGLMVDAGLFDPLVRLIVRLADGDPVKVLVGTAVLALCVSLDGDGSTTYIICVSAMLPLYRRLGLNPLMLACLLMLACGVTNITPWGGPTARAASALGVDPAEVFVALIPAMIAGLAFLFALAWLFGRSERARGRAKFLFEAECVRDRCRAGLYENTPDHHAILGGCEVGGLYFANGFSGHGVMHSPATGRALADIILYGESGVLDVSCLSIERFQKGELLHETAFI